MDEVERSVKSVMMISGIGRDDTGVGIVGVEDGDFVDVVVIAPDMSFPVKVAGGGAPQSCMTLAGWCL